MSLMKEFTKGIWKENPVLILILGMCPTLAVTSSAKNGLAMGVASTFVLICSNVVVSLLRKVIPKEIRIPCYIVIIATFVTLVQMIVKAYAPAIDKSLGIFIPLIVVNCIVLGRAEAFASKNSFSRSLADGLGMGIGFTLALLALGGTREFLCNGQLFEIKILTFWKDDYSFGLMSLAPGAFIVLGFFLAIMNKYNMVKAAKEGKIYTPPAHLNCSSCNLCNLKEDSNEDK